MHPRRLTRDMKIIFVYICRSRSLYRDVFIKAKHDVAIAESIFSLVIKHHRIDWRKSNFLLPIKKRSIPVISITKI